MIRWLKRKIAWAVAGRELAELERWRVECAATRRWLAEFEDVADALDHMQSFVIGRNYDGLANLRVAMRRRRDHVRKFDEALASLSPINTTPKHLDEFSREWWAAYGVMPLIPPVTPPVTDWDVAAQLVDDLKKVMDDEFDRTHAAIMSPPPTRYSGITITV